MKVYKRESEYTFTTVSLWKLKYLIFVKVYQKLYDRQQQSTGKEENMANSKKNIIC